MAEVVALGLDITIAATFIRSLAHREQCEAGAAVLQHGAAATEIRYRAPLAWHWPVQFDYVSEFFCTAPGVQDPGPLR